MSKIKNFLDYITGYSSYKKKQNDFLNSKNEPELKSELSIDEIVQIYEMIKDYLTSLSDIVGVNIKLQKIKPKKNYVEVMGFSPGHVTNVITSLNDFLVQCGATFDDSIVDWKTVESEIKSIKSQLEADDFRLTWQLSSHNHLMLIIQHKSYKSKHNRRFA